MKFKIRVRRVGDTGDGWWEDYDKPTNGRASCLKSTHNPKEWAKVTVERFNATLTRFAGRGFVRYGSPWCYRFHRLAR